MQLKKDFPYGICMNVVIIINYKSIVKYRGIQLLQEHKNGNYDVALFYTFIKTMKI